jgi:hypothetical protein
MDIVLISAAGQARAVVAAGMNILAKKHGRRRIRGQGSEK